MNDAQYKWSLDNTRFRRVRRLGDSAAIARLLRRGRTGARSLARVRAAWERIVDRRLLAVTCVEAVQGGEVVISSSDPVARQQLQAEAPALIRELATGVPGVERLRVVPGGHTGQVRSAPARRSGFDGPA